MSRQATSSHSELGAALAMFRKEFLVAGVFSMVVNLLMLTPSLYMLQVFDRVMMSQNELTLIAVSLITLFLLMTLSFAEWARSRLLVRLSVRMDDLLSDRVFGAAFEARLKQTDVNVARAFSDLTQVRQFLTSDGVIAFFDVPWLFIYLLVLFALHPLLGWVATAGCVVLALLARVTESTTVQPVVRAQDAATQTQLFVQSKMRNSEVIEAMGMLGDLRRRWLSRHRNHLLLHTEAQHRTHSIRALTKFVRYAWQSLGLGAGALLAIQGELSIGGIVAANILMSRALAPAEQLITVWGPFAAARDAYRHLEALLRDNPLRRETAQEQPPSGEVRIERLSATAPGRSEPILHELDLAIGAGEAIGIVGPSGSGKSTLARALMGIWPYTEGRVWFDEATIDSWPRDKLGPYVGYLPQDVQLFEGTVAENIARFGAVDPDKVVRAARLAGVHEMILRFPRGYDTPAGVGGGYLSGGQRQRIALARALYGDPRLVVLDEPNSNLDEVGEAALMAAIRELKAQGSTVVLISHRLGVLGSTDRVVVLNKGRVQQQMAPQAFATRPNVAVAGAA